MRYCELQLWYRLRGYHNIPSLYLLRAYLHTGTQTYALRFSLHVPTIRYRNRHTQCPRGRIIVLF
jgi:hypothetical protein